MQSSRNDVNDCHNGCGELWCFFLIPRLGKTSGMIRGLEHFTLVNLKQHVDIWKELLICSVKLNFQKNKKFLCISFAAQKLQLLYCKCASNFAWLPTGNSYFAMDHPYRGILWQMQFNVHCGPSMMSQLVLPG